MVVVVVVLWVLLFGQDIVGGGTQCRPGPWEGWVVGERLLRMARTMALRNVMPTILPLMSWRGRMEVIFGGVIWARVYGGMVLRGGIFLRKNGLGMLCRLEAEYRK